MCTAKTQLEKQQTTSLISQKPRWRFSLTFVLLFYMYLETIEKILRFYMIILVYHLWVENTFFVRVFSSHLAQGMQNIYWRVFSNTFKWLLKKEQFKTMESPLTPGLGFKIGTNSSSAYKNTTDHSYILENALNIKTEVLLVQMKFEYKNYQINICNNHFKIARNVAVALKIS